MEEPVNESTYDDLKASVIQAARAVIKQFGFAKATMSDIAKALRMGKSSLYHYFPSKEEIFMEVLKGEIRELQTEFLHAIEAESTPEGKLRAYIRTRTDMFRRKLAEHMAFLDATEERYNLMLKIHELYDADEIRMVGGILQLGVDEGRFAIKDIRATSVVFVTAFRAFEYPFFPLSEASRSSRRASTRCLRSFSMVSALDRHFTSFVAFVFRHRRPIIVVFIALTLFFGFWIKDLKVNSDLLSYLPADDPAVKLFHHLGDRFGQNDIVMAALQSDDVFRAATLADIKNLTERFRDVDGVASVISLTNVMDIRPGADGSIDIGMLVDADALPQTDGERAALRERVMTNERYRGSLVSEDARTTLIICQVKAGSDDVALVHRLEAAVASSGVTEAVHFGGNPLLETELGAIISHDFKTLIPIVAVLIIVTLLLAFATFRGVAIPLAAVAMSTIWILGLMGLTGVALTLVSDIIPALLVAIGTAPCIHILSKFDEDVSRYGSDGPASLAAFREVAIRVILAGITIVLGFSSFVIGAYLTTIRDFGIFASIGVCFSLLISLFFVPALVASIRVRPARPNAAALRRQSDDRLMYRAMTKLAGTVVKHPMAILAASGLVMVLGLVGIPFIHRDSDFMMFIDANNPVRVTEGLLLKEFGGSRPLQIDFTGDIENPFVLKEMLRFERFLSGEHLATNAVSVADLVVQMNQIIGDQRNIPDDPAKIADLMFMLEGQDIVAGLMSDDKQEAQVQGMVGIMTTDRLRQTIHALDTYIAGMERRLVIIDATSLPAGDRPIVAGLRARRAAQELCWLAQKRDAELAPDPAAVSALLAGLPPDKKGLLEAAASAFRGAPALP